MDKGLPRWNGGGNHLILCNPSRHVWEQRPSSLLTVTFKHADTMQRFLSGENGRNAVCEVSVSIHGLIKCVLNLGGLQHVCGPMIPAFEIHQERSAHLVRELRSDEILLGPARGSRPAGEGWQRVCNCICLPHVCLDHLLRRGVG